MAIATILVSKSGRYVVARVSDRVNSSELQALTRDLVEACDIRNPDTTVVELDRDDPTAGLIIFVRKHYSR
jgi:hypothetical protein